MIDAERFDLVILDIRMPDLSGIEVSNRLHEQGVPFLVLSAYGDTDVVSPMVRNGALGYLVKPVDVEQMVPAIEAALNRSEEIFQLRTNEKNLQIALDGDRNTSKAVGIIMERHKLSCEDAFEMLRRSARSQRRKLIDVAMDLVLAENTLNSTARPGN
jgi:response regulator NasT